MFIEAEKFEELVARALDGLPGRFQKLLKNVAVVIEPSTGQRKDRWITLGRYHGVPRLARSGVEPALPDRIILYRQELASLVSNENDLVREITRTIWHELGHHIGFSDTELRRLERRQKGPEGKPPRGT